MLVSLGEDGINAISGWKQIIAEDEAKIKSCRSSTKSTWIVYNYFKQNLVPMFRPIADKLGIVYNSVLKAVQLLSALEILFPTNVQMRNRVFIYRNLADGTCQKVKDAVYNEKGGRWRLNESFFIVLYGVSGAGKSMLRDAAVNKLQCLKKLIAVTTRPARQGETEGIDKYFLTDKEFNIKNSEGSLCLTNEVYGFMYAFNYEDFNSGNAYICELYHQDFEVFQKAAKRIVNIYIKPHSLQKALDGIKNVALVRTNV